MRFHVVSTGLYAPANVETAADLAPRLAGWSADDIVRNTGVRRRHVAKGEPTEHLAAQAALQALTAARTRRGDPELLPELILNASLTPVQLIPDSSVFHQEAMGLSGIPSFSVHATCLSFLVALHTSAALLTAGAYRRILVVSAEVGSVCRNFDEPESAALIGDGAASVFLEAADPSGDAAEAPSELLAWDLKTWPDAADYTAIRGCGTRRHPLDPATTRADYLFHMDGRSIFRFAFRRVNEMLDRLFAEASAASVAAGGPPLGREDVDLVVPHQASGNGLRAVSRLGFDSASVVNIIGEYGNCIAASLPMALHSAAAEGRLKRGDLVLLMGTGAGLSVGGALLRW